MSFNEFFAMFAITFLYAYIPAYIIQGILSLFFELNNNGVKIDFKN